MAQLLLHLLFADALLITDADYYQKNNSHNFKSTSDYFILMISNLSENNKYTDNIAALNKNSDATTGSYKNIRMLAIATYIITIFK